MSCIMDVFNLKPSGSHYISSRKYKHVIIYNQASILTWQFKKQESKKTKNQKHQKHIP